jgi:anaerobic ribonucleoside-triphosphate reductase activating protein
MADDPIASLAQIVPETEAEGPGRRFAVWFQGCPLRCPGCCNPEFLPFHGGNDRRVSDIVAELTAANVEGISLLGGEPFAHAIPAAALAKAARERNLSVMIYSGYTLSEIRESKDSAFAELLSLTDVLVDGPYLRDQPETNRRWVGSTNQVVHFLTDRYSPNDPIWSKANTLEIRVRGWEIAVNGFPARDAAGLWKGWRRKAVTRG